MEWKAATDNLGRKNADSNYFRIRGRMKQKMRLRINVVLDPGFGIHLEWIDQQGVEPPKVGPFVRGNFPLQACK